MQIRRQLTVASPLTARDLAGAATDTLAHRDRGDDVRAMIAKEFRADDVVLTDSGTSAFVLALRMLAKPGVPVAMPAYACVDLIAAARPNFMKVAPLYHALSREDWCTPRIVHTGQHYDANMSDSFFRDLRLPEPAHHLGVGPPGFTLVASRSPPWHRRASVVTVAKAAYSAS